MLALAQTHVPGATIPTRTPQNQLYVGGRMSCEIMSEAQMELGVGDGAPSWARGCGLWWPWDNRC